MCEIKGIYNFEKSQESEFKNTGISVSMIHF